MCMRVDHVYKTTIFCFCGTSKQTRASRDDDEGVELSVYYADNKNNTSTEPVFVISEVLCGVKNV